MVLAFHGTNKKGMLSIIQNGFKTHTHFARHLEDSLEFGGSWVFMVEFKKIPDNWQFLNKRHIPVSKIKRLTQYRPIVRIGTQPHLTRKVDSKTESNNLTGKKLT
jgi:hypothetical protein